MICTCGAWAEPDKAHTMTCPAYLSPYQVKRHGTADIDLLEITDWGKREFVKRAANDPNAIPTWEEYWKQYHQKLEAWKDRKVLEGLVNADITEHNPGEATTQQEEIKKGEKTS